MKEQQKKELLLHKIIIKKEDQAMGPDNGTITKIPFTDIIHIMDRMTKTVDDRLTDDQINSPTETMEIDPITEISAIKIERGETMGTFLVHPQDKDGTFLKVILSADLNLFNHGIRHSEGKTITPPLVPLPTNKNFLKATIKHQQTWFVSPPLMIAITS